MLKTIHLIRNFVFRTIKKYSLIYLLHTEKGFSLASLLIATGIFMTLAMLWASYLALTVKTYTKLHNEMTVCDAGRFMQGIIEKDVGYESKKIVIRKDLNGSSVIESQTIDGNKTITISKEDVRLIKKIKSGNGTGSNALYINGCNVEEWYVEQIDNKKIKVSFWLKKNNTRRFFSQIIHCYNGEVMENA